MRRIAWLTDIHLNFLSTAQIEQFCQTIIQAQPDVVLISGDISEAPDLVRHLRLLEGILQRPIFFVLGNHDFYHGSIEIVRHKARLLSDTSEWLKWLPAMGVVQLDEKTGLVGHDSWGDGHLGTGLQSPIFLNDFLLIKELAEQSAASLFGKLDTLGQEAARHFQVYLPEALKRYQHVIVLAHVPPFRESCWHEGRISDDDWLPHFTCHAVGTVLLQIMREHPQRQVTVLCGHTHGSGVAQILDNLEVRTGGAQYGKPHIQETFSVF